MNTKAITLGALVFALTNGLPGLVATATAFDVNATSKTIMSEQQSVYKEMMMGRDIGSTGV